MRKFGWIAVIAAASMMYACLGPDDVSNAGPEQEDAILAESSKDLLVDPCALVRCRAGTQCEVQAGKATCVPMPPKPECASDKECRLFSNYCEGCACLALSTSEPNPVCKGTIVACLLDPCRDSEARCVRGQCVLDGPSASF